MDTVADKRDGRAGKRPAMWTDAGTGRAAGALYLLTFVSIPTVGLYRSLHEPALATILQSDTPALVGALLEVVVALACLGTAAALHPVLKRHGEALAMAFVGARVLEASAIFAGVACILAAVSMRQAGAVPSAFSAGPVLIALYDRLFLLGQGIMPAVNALLLGTLLFRSRLVPRALPMLGLVGAPILLASHVAVLFGHADRVSVFTGLAALPVALWELSLALWLLVRGFDPRAAQPSAGA